METKKRKLGIDGKTVDITNIADKSLAQFRQQLKQNGVVLSEERLESVYNSLHNEAVDENAVIGMTPEQIKAYYQEKYPEQYAKAEKIRKEAEAAALAKLNK